jgi:alkyl sulfatase BDS1-like metallo-beta-lactamase superfamily hydrolase
MTLLLKNGGLYEIKKLEKDKQNYILNVERKILDEKKRQREIAVADRIKQKKIANITGDETANPLHKDD